MPSTTQAATSTRRTRSTGHCEKDTTPPPQPGINMAYAFDRASKRATFTRDTPVTPPRSGLRYDPVYIELTNVEPGTRFELLNLSKRPNGTFAKHGIMLEPTGRDLPNRMASIYLNDAQLTKLDIKSGDTFALRAVDASGNASEPVRAQLDYQNWANGTINDTIDRKPATSRGAQLTLLDGEAKRKNLLARVITDGRAPVMLTERVTMKGSTGGNATLYANQAIEPGGGLRVNNLRTGDAFYGSADPTTGALEIALTNMAAGDPLSMIATDVWGNEGKEVHLTYAPKCKGGKAKAQPAYLTRLNGVI